METLKIEKRVPIPGVKRGTGIIGVIKSLKVGDSFYLKGKKAVEIASSTQYAKYKFGICLSCRTDNGGVRVWRVK